MGSKPSSSTNSTQTFTPPSSVLAAYNNVTSQAQAVASTPYQAYTGELVAPVNSQQQTGINAVNSASGLQNGYNAGATGLAAASSGAIDPTQFSASQVGQYESPYNNDVIQATEAQLQNTDQQQSSALTGNAISAGAMGGDRAGVAQAALAGQQDIANNSTIAGLENQNYQQALSEFNTQQSTDLSAQQNTAARQLAASQQLGTLGSTAQTEALNEANAQTNAGTLEQTTQQAQDTANYNQFLQQEAYPFQTTGWLANIVEGIGSQEGGTTTGQSQTNSSGLSTAVGGLLGLGSLQARGGRVPSMARGGGLAPAHMASGGGLGGAVSLIPYQSAMDTSGLGGGSIVPTASLSIGNTMPKGMPAPTQQQPQQTPAQQAQQIGQVAKDVQGLGNGIGGLFGQNGSGDYSQAGAAAYGLANGLTMDDIGGLARGGAVPHFDAGGDVGSVNDLLFNPDSDALPIADAKFIGGDTAPASAPPTAGLAAATAPDTSTATSGLTPAAAPSVPGFSGQVPVSGGYPAPPPTASAAAPTGLAPPPAAAQSTDSPPPADSTFAKMIHVESGGRQFDNNGQPLVSSKGAVGIAQVMPGTAPEAAALAGLKFDPARYYNDPNYNLALGRAYYQKQLQDFGSPDRAAAAYNAGPGAVSMALAKAEKNGGSYLDYLPAETRLYVANVTGAGGQGSGGLPSGAMAYDDNGTSQPSSGPLAAIGRALGLGGAQKSSGQPTGLGAASASDSDGFSMPVKGGSGHHGLLGLFDDDTRNLLLNAGLGIMGGTSRNPWINIGQGGLAGLAAARQTQQNQADIGLKQAQTKNAQTENEIKQAQVNAMISALGKISGGSGSSGSSAAQAPPAVTTPTVTAPTVAGNGAQASSGAPSAAPSTAGQATRIDPNWDVDRLRQQAQLYAAAGLPALSKQFQDQADMILKNGMTRDVNGRMVPLPGYNETVSSTAGAKAGAEEGARLPFVGPKAAAEAAGKSNYDLVEVQPTPGGPTQWVSKADALKMQKSNPQTATAGVGAGSPPGAAADAIAASNPAVAKQPEFVAEKQKKIADDESAMLDQYKTRQIARQRLEDLGNILQTYQPGAFAEQKASLVAKLRGIGIDVPNSATANPGAFEKFVKDSTANVFDQAKSLGGRILVTELTGLKMANANPELQPEANRAIIGQGIGLLNYEDQHANDYFAWKKQNPYAYDTSQFELGWTKDHPVSDYVKAARNEVPVAGERIPPPAQRESGQVYMTPKGKMRWMGSGWRAEQ